MALQQQLLSEADDSIRDKSNSRLSRVVTKLFGKVIKVEETKSDPFSLKAIDIEALLCFSEDLLVSIRDKEEQSLPPERNDSTSPSEVMVKTLLNSIVKAHNGSTSLLEMLDALEIDPRSSALALMIHSCELSHHNDAPDVVSRLGKPSTMAESVELGLQRIGNSEVVSQKASAPRTSTNEPISPPKDVATLVGDLASAPAGPQRETALESLREYKRIHGDEELNSHLEQLSTTFRAYIKDQLDEGSSPQKVPIESSASSMSTRLRNLKSRLQATELVVQTAVQEDSREGGASAHQGHQESSSLSQSRVIESPSKQKSKLTPTKQSAQQAFGSPTKRTSKLSQPSPSRLFAPSPSRISGASSQTLRERLAAAQAGRRTAAVPTETTDSSSTATGRAAALRARLEMVKQQASSNHDS